MKLDKLFDICSCKCENFDECNCPKKSKVPPIERPFLIDQRGNRIMGIGQVDLPTTMQIRQRELRAQGPSPLPSTSSAIPSTSGIRTHTQIQVIQSDSTNSSSSPELDCPVADVTFQCDDSNLSDRNELHLNEVAIAADRYGLSDEAVAAICSALLSDIGLITETNTHLVIDTSKVRRARQLHRKPTEDAPTSILSIYFDGRKDTTKVFENGRLIEIKEEHISLIEEPDSHYVGHFTPIDGTSLKICNGILDFLTNKSIDTKGLRAVGCDAAAVNVGRDKGVIRTMETILGRPLQWIACLYHLNELPLRAIIVKMDGPTAGPNAYSGKIGGKLKNCEQLPIVEFRKQMFQLSVEYDEFVKDLRADQLYLFNMCTAISNGSIAPNLAVKSPGKMSHARWLTTANRILRLYVSSSKPTILLTNIVKYILNIYAPAFFEIKARPSIVYGAKHFANLVIRSRFLPPDMKKIIDEVFKRNAFFANTENLLLAMTNDEQETVRELAWFRIKEARAVYKDQQRVFTLPSINFEATNYVDIIQWNEKQITPPPLLDDVEVAEHTIRPLLLKRLKDHDFAEKIIGLPCHTQAVERCVKSVTRASLKVSGPTARHGYIMNELKSRSTMPSFRTKKQFTVSTTSLNKLQI